MGGLIGFVLVLCVVAVAGGHSGAIGQARGGSGEGGTVIPGVVQISPPSGTATDTVNFVQTIVYLTDGAGEGIGRVWVVVRNTMGDIVAVAKTNSQGIARIVTEGPQGVMLDAVQVGVAGVPFAPGSSMLIVVDQ